MSICILADAADIDRAKLIELEYNSVDDLKKLNKNKKLVKSVCPCDDIRDLALIGLFLRNYHYAGSSPRSTMLSWLLRLSSSRSLVS
jgi:hypothetical protein